MQRRWLSYLLVLYNQQEYKLAAPLCAEALEIERKLLQPNDVIIAAALNNLAEIHKHLGEDEPAENYYKQAIDVYKKAEGKTGRGLVDTYSNLAMLYKRQGRYELARGTMVAARKVQKEQSPGDVIGMASVLNTMASIERAEFENRSAREHYLEAIALLAKSDKTAEEPLCDTRDNYADLLLDEREYEDAEKQYQLSIQHCEQARGPNHPCVAERMLDLGNLYRRVGKPDRAEELMRKALAINLASFDADSPIVVNTINDLSAVYVDQKKYKDAHAVYARWIPQLTEELGENHPHVADALENWALAASHSHNESEADALRRRAKTIRTNLTRKPESEARSGSSTELTLQKK